MENLVVIATCQEAKEAYYLKLKLENEGIDAYLVGSAYEKSKKKSASSRPLKLQVSSASVEKAIQILIQVHEELKSLPYEEEKQSTKRILVPIDFSKNSSVACLFAFALAKKMGAEIKLLHVFNDPFVDSGYISNRISFEKYERNVLLEIEEMARRNIVAFLQVLQIDLKKFGLDDVKFHYNLMKGKPSYQIISISELFNPFMIVIGTQGAGKMPNDIIGSVTTKVIESTNIPILAIPENWSYKSSEKLNILYATDFYSSDLDAFKNLVEIMKPFNVHFDCVHIESHKTRQKDEMQMFKLESCINKEFPNVSIQCHLINHKKLINGIQKFVDEAGIDIISFTSPKRSIFYKLVFPNNLKKMVYQSKIPLLIFHNKFE
jgi:nucleotide-binding universal stress UspA family protein